jgi:hypothetical protein
MKYVVTSKAMINLVDKIIKNEFPNFNKEKTSRKNTGRFNETFYDEKNKDFYNIFAIYYTESNDLQINSKIYEVVSDFIGEKHIGYLLDWFNREFDTDAQYLTL